MARGVSLGKRDGLFHASRVKCGMGGNELARDAILLRLGRGGRDAEDEEQHREAHQSILRAPPS